MRTNHILKQLFCWIFASQLLLPSELQANDQLNANQLNPPAFIYHREDMLASGHHTAADFIRHLPINVFGSQRPSTGLSDEVDNTVSIRGLGAERTLLLIDGRRLPESPINGGWQNLAVIPLAVIERIEVLPSGQVVEYGDGAMAGIIHIITRADFQGAELMLSMGQPALPQSGGEFESGSLTFGNQSEAMSMMTTVSWDQRQPVFRQALPWDETQLSLLGRNFTTLVDGQDQFNFTAIPNACDLPDSTLQLIPTENSINERGQCASNSMTSYFDEPEIKNKAFINQMTYALSDFWQLSANTQWSQQQSHQQSTPPAYSSFYLDTPLSPESPNNPTNPNSPLYDPALGLAPQAVNWWVNFAPQFPRSRHNQTEWISGSVQLKGQYTDHLWQLGWHQSNHRFDQVGRNYFLHEATLAAVESGAFDLQTPYASQAGVLDALRVTAYRDARHDQQTLFGQYTHQGMALSGGDLTTTAKAEYRQEKFRDVHDPLSLAGQLNGGFDVVRNRHGKQSIADLSLLLQAPVHTRLTLDAGIRYSDSNRFKAATAAHLTMTYQPWDSLQIHAAYSRDFNRPSLYQGPSNDGITTEDIFYPPVCLGAPQAADCYLRDMTVIDRFSQSLRAEKSDNWLISFNHQPTDRTHFKLIYMDTTIKDVIRFFPSQYVALANDVPDIIIPSGMGCADGVCVVGYGNVGQQDQQSVLLEMGFEAEVLGGRYETSWHSVHVLEDRYVGILPLSYENPRYYPDPIKDSGNQVGALNRPKHRMQWRHSFRKNNWQLQHQLNLIGSQDQLTYEVNSRTPTWVTHDLQLNYHSSWQGQITLGAQNLLDKEPPLGQQRFTAERYQSELFNPFGRIIYARYTQTF